VPALLNEAKPLFQGYPRDLAMQPVETIKALYILDDLALNRAWLENTARVIDLYNKLSPSHHENLTAHALQFQQYIEEDQPTKARLKALEAYPVDGALLEIACFEAGATRILSGQLKAPLDILAALSPIQGPLSSSTASEPHFWLLHALEVIKSHKRLTPEQYEALKKHVPGSSDELGDQSPLHTLTHLAQITNLISIEDLRKHLTDEYEHLTKQARRELAGYALVRLEDPESIGLLEADDILLRLAAHPELSADEALELAGYVDNLLVADSSYEHIEIAEQFLSRLEQHAPGLLQGAYERLRNYSDESKL
jgi:hypothetical protein